MVIYTCSRRSEEEDLHKGGNKKGGNLPESQKESKNILYYKLDWKWQVEELGFAEPLLQKKTGRQNCFALQKQR